MTFCIPSSLSAEVRQNEWSRGHGDGSSDTGRNSATAAGCIRRAVGAAATSRGTHRRAQAATSGTGSRSCHRPSPAGRRPAVDGAPRDRNEADLAWSRLHAIGAPRAGRPAVPHGAVSHCAYETAGAVAPTRLGRFLARTGLADLPILWNVVAGSMSLVGPRPVTAAAASHPSMMGSPTLAVKPGVTGPWRVAVFADGRARAHADRGYAASCSLLGDLSLLARTPKALLWPIRQ